MKEKVQAFVYNTPAEGSELPCHPVYKLPCVVVYVFCNYKIKLRAARAVTDTSDSVQWDTSCIHRNRIIDLADAVSLRTQIILQLSNLNVQMV